MADSQATDAIIIIGGMVAILVLMAVLKPKASSGQIQRGPARGPTGAIG